MSEGQFLLPHSPDAIEVEIDKAQTLIEIEGSGYPDDTYEDGVIAALRWVQGLWPEPTSDAIEHLDK
ncbi:hypothetical protein OPW41_18195 [Vibrio europaeus]|uniref:hypothetical protein n=1 Tax=Vibrio europaeus TaxID=300876 RepID=UPI00233F66D9|nr:hypothetical protein [Vibrio europaeus]MDC5753835.1 hypothetical protein [Vibrio europaeus]MDC5776747.1 hypothetical protein [Vibrio europaeus]MDC5796763.1 hypothetical protein [Vibrio europaeus]MDC5801760.1 hypothetical protein [Vibrio europaeus]MDC5815733.1 hypothetical protein [Vibrio europaeus]